MTWQRSLGRLVSLEFEISVEAVVHQVEAKQRVRRLC